MCDASNHFKYRDSWYEEHKDMYGIWLQILWLEKVIPDHCKVTIRKGKYVIYSGSFRYIPYDIITGADIEKIVPVGIYEMDLFVKGEITT